MSHTCPAGLPGGILDWYIAKDIAQAEEFLMLFAPNDLVVVVAGEGGTISSHPIKIALQVAFQATQAVALGLEQTYFINDECEQNNHRAIIHDVVGPRVDVTVSTRATQSSVDDLDADLVAHDANIDADLMAHDINISNRLGTVQTTLDTVTEMKRVHLQVIEIKEKKRFLLAATEAGEPVDVALIAVQVAGGDDDDEHLIFEDITPSATSAAVKAGILDVKLKLPKAARDAEIFEFRVEHDHGTFKHFGTILIHRIGDKNLGAGQ